VAVGAAISGAPDLSRRYKNYNHNEAKVGIYYVYTVII